jgi:hypothetical protein
MKSMLSFLKVEHKYAIKWSFSFFWWLPIWHTSKSLRRMLLLTGSSTGTANAFPISFTDRQHWTPYNSWYFNRKKHRYKSRKESTNSIPHSLERDPTQHVSPPRYMCHTRCPHHRRTHHPRSRHQSSADAAWHVWPTGTIQGMFCRPCQCACGRSSQCSAHTCATHQCNSDGGHRIPSHFIDWHDWTCKVTVHILEIQRIVYVNHTY